MLTSLERKMLQFIRGYLAQHGQGPTLTEIGEAPVVQRWEFRVRS